MTVVVTGATGHVGANLVRRLLAQQRHVRVLIHINRKAVQGLDVEIAEGDVCDIGPLYDAFNGADVVYHLAARVSISMDDWPLLGQVNVMGTRNVVTACLHTGVRRLVHFSSIHALCQEPLELPLDESQPLVKSKRCPPYGLVFAIWTIGNLAPRSRAHHIRYREHFSDYPPERKALVPGIW